MNDTEILKWIIFGLIILHFLLSSFMWIKNDSIEIEEQGKQKINFKRLFQNNGKVFFLSIIIFSLSLLFISLDIFDKNDEEE